MSDCLVQRHFLRRHKYELGTEGVSVTEVALFDPRKYWVPFENISQEPIEITTSSKLQFWAMIVLFAIAIITGILYGLGQDVEKSAPAVWGGLGILVSASYLLSREHFLVYGSRSVEALPLVIFKDKPSKIKMQEFVAAVQKKKARYLKTKYLFGHDTNDSADVIRKLLWLREQNAITDEEFEKLKKDAIIRSGGGNIQPPSMN